MTRRRPAIPIVVVRQGQRILAQVRAPFQAPFSGPGRVVLAGGWHAAACAPDHCYPFLARAVGRAEIVATTPSGCNVLPGPPVCILGLREQVLVYVEPSRCSGRTVSARPAAPVSSPPLAAVGLAAREHAGTEASFGLARFTDRDPEFNSNAALYDAAVDWGDGFPPDVATVAGARRTGYSVSGRHFYCQAGTYTIALTISKSAGADYHPGASVTVRLHVRVTA